MRAALKPFAFLAALFPVIAPKVANAETLIDTARTTPVTTSGVGDDVRITSAGSVKPSTLTGAAVTLDSSKNVTNQGTIEFNNSTGTATGILIDTTAAARTGNVLDSGAINLIEDYTGTDSDSDGDLDGLFAQGSNRFGIRLIGANGLTGNITVDSAAAISIEGNNSAAIELDGPLAGNLKVAGTMTVIGNNSYGIRTTEAITGGVDFTGSITTRGGASRGISIEDNVSGQVHLQGTIANNGYRVESRPTDAVIAKLDLDDALLGGPAVAITGNLGGGLLFDAPPPDLDSNNADEDSDGVADASETTSIITQTGSQPAVKIGDGGGAAITLSNVGSGASAYGAINKGSITAVSIFSVIPTTSTLIPTQAVRIENANLTGGFSNTGSMVSGSFDANSTALSIGAGSTLGGINNSGTITANVVSELVPPVGSAIAIDAGANVGSLTNSGSLIANITGEKADGIVISDASNSLHLITNSGAITVSRTVTDDANDTDDADTDPSNEVVTGRDIAIDLHLQTTGTTISQVAPSSSTASDPHITGNILFGSGADILDIQKGQVTGDVSFGAGADQLLISGGGNVFGAVSDSDNNLAINVSDGDLVLKNSGNLTISSLNVGASGNVALTLDPAASANGRITVNGASGATFASGAQVSVLLKSAIPGAPGVPTVFNLVTTTGGGTINGTQPDSSLQVRPFLYDGAFSTIVPGVSTTLDLTLTRKNAVQLGLNKNETAFYEPFFQAALGDAALMESFLGLGTQQSFKNGFDQFMPNATGSQVEFATTREQALSQMLFSRYLGNVKPTRDIYAWANEISYSRDREMTTQGQGYEGFGFGFAFGLDGPMGKTGYKGFGIALTSDEIDRKTGFDQPFTVTSAEVTGHVVQPIGDLVLGARVGAAYDVFRSKRQIVIDPDLDVTGITRAPKADWNGAHISAALHAAYPTHLGFVSVRPEVGIDAVSMWEQEYEEKGGGAGLNLAIDSRQTTRANASATVAFGLPFQRRGFAFTPEVTLGVRAPLLKDPYDLSGHFVSATSQQFTLASESYDSPAAIAGLALNVEGPIGSFRLEGQAEQSDGETTATGRLVLRLTF